MAQNGRSAADIIIKSITTLAATTVMVGHLSTLRHLPRRIQTFQVTGSLVSPMLPFAQFSYAIYRICRITRLSFSRYTSPQRHTWKYYQSAALGVHAVPRPDRTLDPDELSIPLLDLDPEWLTAEPGTYDIRLIARVIVILLSIQQAVLSLNLWARRVQYRQRTKILTPYGIISVRANAPFDHGNAIYAVGGLVAGIKSLAIELYSWKWSYSTPLWRDHYGSTAVNGQKKDKAYSWQLLLPTIISSSDLTIISASEAFFEPPIALAACALMLWGTFRVSIQTILTYFHPRLGLIDLIAASGFISFIVLIVMLFTVRVIATVLYIFTSQNVMTLFRHSRLRITSTKTIFLLTWLGTLTLRVWLAFASIISFRAAMNCAEHFRCENFFLWNDPRGGYYWTL